MLSHRNPVVSPQPGDAWMVPRGSFKELAVVFSVDESGVHVRLGNAVVRVPHLSFRNYLQGAEKMPLRIAA